MSNYDQSSSFTFNSGQRGLSSILQKLFRPLVQVVKMILMMPWSWCWWCFVKSVMTIRLTISTSYKAILIGKILLHKVPVLFSHSMLLDGRGEWLCNSKHIASHTDYKIITIAIISTIIAKWKGVRGGSEFPSNLLSWRSNFPQGEHLSSFLTIFNHLSENWFSSISNTVTKMFVI